ESKELKVLRILANRKVLSVEEAAQLANLEKGFEGELKFDERVGRLSKDWLVLNDLLLKSNNAEFQLDSILIAQKTILLFDIKNYEGDYYIEDGKWYYNNGKVIQNPVSQLERSETLFRRLLQEHGFNIPIESYLVFINPDFHLYNAPRNLPIVFPTQLNRFFDNLKKIPTKTNEHHVKLAQKIISLHQEEWPYSNIPKYYYEELRKGISCACCYSFKLESKRSILVCKNCGNIEKVEVAVIRSVEEYRLLFPDRKITSRNIYEWCNGIRSTETIRNILSKNYVRVGNTKSSYYEKKPN
ncbi:NERD domain-containing protein, partial [Bacillus sp. IITD106]|nr:NERD domain-containing protein [Bacillus sp. IITD106]